MHRSRRTLDASIVICTHSRPRSLARTLRSLAAMDVPPGIRHEVIVIANNATPETVAAARANASACVRVIDEAAPGGTRARNIGFAEARGRYLFVTDDDCLVAPDWLVTGIRLLDENPRQIIGGRLDLDDPADLPMTIKTDPEPADLTSATAMFGFIHGCNMILGADVLDEIGAMDPRLGPGTRCKAAEDTDLTYRALRAGIPVHYRPELRARHAHGRRGANEEARLRRAYCVAAGAMALKHLLRGRLDVARTLYWVERGYARAGMRNPVSHYLAGAANYVLPPVHARIPAIAPVARAAFARLSAAVSVARARVARNTA